MDPTRLGPYTIRGQLGRGGMGTVYEAVDPSGTAVAVKTLRAHLGDIAGVRRRFESEIEALKELRHPRIVRLLAFGEEEGRPFFAMELVRGHSLEELLKAGRRFTWEETVATALEITRALKAAHDRGIVHRDLKPANLLFPDAEGPDDGVKLADFGIARLFGDSRQTQAGTVVGTAEYMAPEQAAGEPVDQRVDLYALGLVMYAMLVGRPPFRGPDLADVLRRQQRETPPRVSSFVPEVPPSLDTLIEKMLSKKPGDRPGSALAVGRLLTAIGADSHATPLTEQNAPGVTFTTHGVHSTRPFNRESCESDTGVDLLAATVGAGSNAVPIGETKDSGDLQERSAVDRAPPTPSTAGADQSLVHRRTESFERSPGDDRPTGNRFTTIEDLQRQAQNDAERAARREAVFRGGLAAILFAGVLAGGYALLRPATADQLHARILAVADDPAADLRDAQPLIDLFLARFPEDPRADAIRSLDRSLAIDALERRARRRPRSDATLSPLERDYRAAMAREEDSPLACLAALEAILAIHDPAPEPTPTASLDAADAPDLWLALVRRQIERVDPIAARERAEDLARVSATLAEAANLAETATTSPPAERQDLLARREALLEGLIEIYGSRPHAAEAVAEAQQVLESPSP
jgi:eukaryotic-like serine/threonine-protein kinase